MLHRKARPTRWFRGAWRALLGYRGLSERPLWSNRQVGGARHVARRPRPRRGIGRARRGTTHATADARREGHLSNRLGMAHPGGTGGDHHGQRDPVRPAAQLRALTDFGYNVGLAFQIIDDILDITQTSEQLGKTAGKDNAAQKATYPSIVGLNKSRKIAKQLTARAFDSLRLFRGKAQALEALATHLLHRDR